MTNIHFDLIAEETTQGLLRLLSTKLTHPFCAAAALSGIRDLCSIGPFSSWGSLDARLRAKCLVHSDGCLHSKAVIKEVE